MKKLSVYIHIPFCESKCLYCDFASFKSDVESRSLYVKRLVEEIKAFDSTGYVVDSIFFGGGTPTILSENEFELIVSAIFDKFNVQIDEFTLEGNPNSYTKDKLKTYKNCGVTRFSVGVQSLNDKILKAIGRVYNAEQALECVKMLVASGLDVNADMMIGLPYQSLEIVERDIDKILQLGVGHLSCYSLILEENTPIFSLISDKKLILPNEDTTVDMYDKVCELTKKFGLKRYEISNFGKPCLHNIGYWTMKEYAGFGLSAHSLIGNVRYYNTNNFADYLKGENYLQEEVLSLADMATEYAMLSFRMDKGIDVADFVNKYGKEQLQNLLDKIKDDIKYYNINNNYISIKPEYMYVSNSLIEKII